MKQQSGSRNVTKLGHIILIRTNQFLLLLFNASCLAFGFDMARIRSNAYNTGGKNADNYIQMDR